MSKILTRDQVLTVRDTYSKFYDSLGNCTSCPLDDLCDVVSEHTNDCTLCDAINERIKKFVKEELHHGEV